MGTTTLGIIVSVSIMPVSFFGQIIYRWLRGRKGGATMKMIISNTFKQTAFFTAVSAIIIGFVIYVALAIRFIYNDHKLSHETISKSNERIRSYERMAQNTTDKGRETKKPAVKDTKQNVPDEKEKKKKDIRDTLGKFLNYAIQIQQKCLGRPGYTLSPQKTCRREFEDWNAELRQYLGTNLDRSYISRLENTAGTPVAVPQGMSEDNTHVWMQMQARIGRLEEFIKEHPLN
jgi:hypothetical protein